MVIMGTCVLRPTYVCSKQGNSKRGHLVLCFGELLGWLISLLPSSRENHFVDQVHFRISVFSLVCYFLPFSEDSTRRWALWCGRG